MKLMPPEGIVIVLEAPLLLEKKMNGKVLGYVKKGDVIFINDKDVEYLAFRDRMGYQKP